MRLCEQCHCESNWRRTPLSHKVQRGAARRRAAWGHVSGGRWTERKEKRGLGTRGLGKRRWWEATPSSQMAANLAMLEI
jgi:hypothetical protein